MTKYPSLYAALEPATGPDGRRGATVRCTATRRDLGFVWWSCASNVVTWHFRIGETTGERTTERNAVQALRDVSNGALAQPLPFCEPVTSAEPQPYIDTGERPIVRRDAPAPSRRVIWGDVPTDAADLTSAIGAALKRHQGRT